MAEPRGQTRSETWRTIFTGEGFYYAMAIRKQEEEKLWWKYKKVLSPEEQLIIKAMRGWPKWLKKKQGVE